MIRRQDWPERLAEFLAARQDTPFAWGTNDCCSFAADWVEAATGYRPALPAYRPTAAGAALALEDAGGIEAAVTAALGEPLAHPGYAQRGDVALIGAGHRLSLGVVVGEYVAGPDTDGMMYAPQAAIVAAWRIGRA